MLTPEGKKVPTRGRGMSAKKATGQDQETKGQEQKKVVKQEEEEEVEVVDVKKEKAEEKTKEEAKQWVVQVVFGGRDF